MDEAATRIYWACIPFLKNLSTAKLDISVEKSGGDAVTALKVPYAMQARPVHDVECPRERMLVDGWKRVNPKQELNPELFLPVNRKRRLPKGWLDVSLV